MKKNIMMRVASVMLIAVLLSTCTISGTFAKYVTTESAEDEARVAKFGVVITASGSLFSDKYIDNPETSGDLTVVSSGGLISNVVAPGTKNTNGLSFALEGAPEVDVQVTIDVDDTTLSEIFLAEGTYQDMTGDAEKFTTGRYAPVVFTLTQVNTHGTDVQADLTLAALKTALEDLSGEYEANDDLEDEIGELTITWAWNFTEHAGIENDDKADTVLGDLAAGLTVQKDADTDGVLDTNVVAGTDYCLETAIKITVTVTQIDKH